MSEPMQVHRIHMPNYYTYFTKFHLYETLTGVEIYTCLLTNGKLNLYLATWGFFRGCPASKSHKNSRASCFISCNHLPTQPLLWLIVVKTWRWCMYVPCDHTGMCMQNVTSFVLESCHPHCPPITAIVYHMYGDGMVCGLRHVYCWQSQKCGSVLREWRNQVLEGLGSQESAQERKTKQDQLYEMKHQRQYLKKCSWEFLWLTNYCNSWMVS